MKHRNLGKSYRDGEILFQEGDVGNCMFVIQEGHLEVIKTVDGQDVIVDVMQKGEVFGEMSIIERQARSATVRARGEARVLTIDSKTFLKRIQQDPSIAFNMLKTMSMRIRKLDTELAAIKGDRTEILI